MKNLNKTVCLVALTCALGVSLGGCSATEASHGNMVEDYRLSEITAGISTRQNVLKSLGSPTTTAPFDETIWYYIGQKTERKAFFDPKVVEEKVVVVAFDPDGIVETIEEIDADRINVPRVRRKTHTGGNEVTIMQQLLGNMGKFNTPKSTTPGI